MIFKIKYESIFLLLVVSIMLHNINRLSTIYAIIPILLYLISFAKIKFYKVSSLNLFYIFIIFHIYIIIISFIKLRFDEWILALIRFSSVIPISLLAICIIKRRYCFVDGRLINFNDT